MLDTGVFREVDELGDTIPVLGFVLLLGDADDDDWGGDGVLVGFVFVAGGVDTVEDVVVVPLLVG